MDHEGTHHELSAGMHGQKLDFDTIPTGSPLYKEWVDVMTAYIREGFSTPPEAIVGVANGTNRLALDVARRFNGRTLGLISEKDDMDAKSLRLSELALKAVAGLLPRFVIVVEDVGTTGSNSVQIAQQIQDAGAHEVVVINTWQRRERLEKLEAAKTPYLSIINQELPTYSLEDCSVQGYCAKGWKLVQKTE